MGCRGNSARARTPCWRTHATDAANCCPNRAATLPLWRIAAMSIDVICPCRPLLLFDFLEGRGAKSQRCAGPVLGAGALVCFLLSKKNEGSRTPTGAGAEAPHPVTCLAVRSISGSPEMTAGSPAGAPLGALLRRSPYGVGPRFRRWRKACPPIVSRLPAGGRSTSGRSPDAARVPVASRQRGRRPSPRPGIAGRRLPD